MMDNYGIVLNCNDFCLKHGFVCHPKEFYTGILIKGILSHYSVTFSLPCPCLGELSIRDHKCNNKYTISVFIDRIHPNIIKSYYIFKDCNTKEVKEMRMSYLAFPSLPKAKELHFKIINDICPSK